MIDATRRSGEGPRQPMGILASLGSLSFGVQSAFDTQGLITSVAEHVLELARADQFALLLLDYETGELAGDHFERGSAGSTGASRLIPESESFLGRVLRRETLVVEATLADEIGWSTGIPETLIGVPIVIGTSLLGVAVIGYRRRITVTDRRRRGLLFLADQIGLAVDRIRTRQELEAVRRQAEEAALAVRRVDEAKSDLISIVSHELRTPLTAIKAYTETLLDNLESPSFTMQEKFLRIVNEECDRLSRIVNDVLDLSRMESGRRRLHASPVALASLLQEVLTTLQPELGQKRLRVALDVGPELPPIEADADLLRQVLVNLMANAIKFTRPDTEITVRAHAVAERITIRVEDRGMGIPPDKLARIFERFYRVEESGADRIGGTGLGLAIVKGVVELHGGTVRAESVIGEGSSFVLELPLKQQGFRNLLQSLRPLFERPELRALLQSCVEMVAEIMEARIISFMFFDEERSELRIEVAHGLDSDTVARTRVKTGDSIAGWVAQTSEYLCVTDVETDRRFRKMNHPQYETKSLLCVPLKISGETVGVVNVNNKSTGTPFDPDDLQLLTAIVRRVGSAIERVRAAGETGDVAAMLAAVRAIVRARRSRLVPTSRRAFKMAMELGRRLKLSQQDVEALGYIVRIHDVGMLAVGDELLRTARRWTQSEHRRIESHPQAGVQLLRPIEFASIVNSIVLSHHEHFDGRGYPRGLRGEEIPLGARILAVLDAFDAMTVGRPYREPFTSAEAVAELRRCAGTQFDPSVVEAFVGVVDSLPLSGPETSASRIGAES